MYRSELQHLIKQVFVTLAIIMMSVVFSGMTAFALEPCYPGEECGDFRRSELLKRLDLSIGQKNYSESLSILENLQMFSWSKVDQHKLQKLESIIREKFKPKIKTNFNLAPTSNLNDGSNKSIQPIYIGNQVIQGNLSPDARALSGLELMLGVELLKPMYISTNKVISATLSAQRTFKRLDDTSSSKVPNIAHDAYDTSHIAFGLRHNRKSTRPFDLNMISAQLVQHYLGNDPYNQQMRVEANMQGDQHICERQIKVSLEVNNYRSGTDDTVLSSLKCSLARKSSTIFSVEPYFESKQSFSLDNNNRVLTIGLGATGSLGLWQKLPLKYEMNVKKNAYNYGYFGGPDREDTNALFKLSARLPVSTHIGDLVVSVGHSRTESNVMRFSSDENFASLVFAESF